MDAFNVENRVWTFLNKLTDLFLLSVLRFVFSIPLITAGAAAAGCYNGMAKIAEDTDSGVWKDFISGFKAGFKTATKAWLLQMLVTCVLALNAYVSFRVKTPLGVFIMILNLALLLFTVAMALYVYPMISQYNFGFKKVLWDSAVIAVTHLPHSLSLLALLAVLTYLSVRIKYLCIVAIPVFFYQVARVAVWIFKKYGEAAPGSPQAEVPAPQEEHNP